MDINNNEFFGDIKHDELDGENISASGIRYGESTNNSSSTKTILIAIGVGAIVAGALVLALNPNKKSSPTNLAEIPTISAPSDSIKTEPQEQKLNEVYENASVYAPVNFDDEAKKLISADVVKPAPIPPSPVAIQRPESIRKIEIKKPVTLKPASGKKATKPVSNPVAIKPVKPVSIANTNTTANTVKPAPKVKSEIIEHTTNVKNEVEVSKVSVPTTPVKPATTKSTKAISGNWSVQLASTSSETSAQKEWLNLSAKHPSILKGLNHAVLRTEISGKTFYRLRIVGLESSAVATDICNKLKAQNLSCFATK